MKVTAKDLLQTCRNYSRKTGKNVPAPAGALTALAYGERYENLFPARRFRREAIHSMDSLYKRVKYLKKTAQSLKGIRSNFKPLAK